MLISLFYPVRTLLVMAVGMALVNSGAAQEQAPPSQDKAVTAGV